MANEATASVSLDFSKGGRVADISFIGLQSDVAGDQYANINQVVGTTGAALEIGGCAAHGGLVVGKCISAAGTITFYINGETDFITYKAGDPFVLRLVSGTSVLVKADAADREIEFLVLEA